MSTNSNHQSSKDIVYFVSGQLLAVAVGLGAWLVTGGLIVGVLIATGVSVGVILLLVLIAVRRGEYQAPQETKYTSRGMIFGTLLGAMFGLAMGIALDNMAFMSIYIGAGLAIGSSLDQRIKQDES